MRRKPLPPPSIGWAPGIRQRATPADLVRDLVLELERRREVGVAIREHDDDGLGLLYYETDAFDDDEDARALASQRLVREVAVARSRPASSDRGHDVARIVASARLKFRSERSPPRSPSTSPAMPAGRSARGGRAPPRLLASPWLPNCRELPFQGSNTGSIPVGDANEINGVGEIRRPQECTIRHLLRQRRPRTATNRGRRERLLFALRLARGRRLSLSPGVARWFLAHMLAKPL